MYKKAANICDVSSSGPRNSQNGTISGPRNHQEIKISGPIKLHYGSGSFLAPEIVNSPI